MSNDASTMPQYPSSIFTNDAIVDSTGKRLNASNILVALFLVMEQLLKLSLEK